MSKKIIPPVILLIHSVASIIIGMVTKIVFKSFEISSAIILFGTIGLLLSILWIYRKTDKGQAVYKS